ncbi:MAG: hypothetical protein IK046_00750 [Clostridia bacterium]|nr:hypothetical protein [Clostridia bacterium]
MSNKPKKYTSDVLAMGAAALVGSFGLQRLLLQPKTEVEISGVKIPVQGIMPYSQKYVADIGRKVFNDVIPVSMSVAVTVCEKLHVREQFKKGFLWFVYEFMARYSFNSVSGFFMRKLKRGNRDEYKNLLRNYVQKLISEKTDREAVIKSATEEIMKILAVITEGTVASLIFNEKVAEAASATISAAVNRFLADDAANRLTEYILRAIEQLEDMTLPGFLEGVLGIGRVEMANLIDTTYDAVLSHDTVKLVRDMHAGDIVADLVNNVDYSKSYDYVSGTSLLKVGAVSAFAAMSFYSAAKKVEDFVERFIP